MPAADDTDGTPPLLDRLESKLDRLGEQAGELKTLIHAVAQRQGVHGARLEAVERDVRTLNALVRNGDGFPGLIERTRAVECGLDAVRQGLAGLNRKIEANAQQVRSQLDRSADGRRNVYLAAAAAGTAMVSAVIGAVATYFWH